MNFNLDNLVRENIKSLKPYSSARHEFKGEASVFLDANENSYGSPVLLHSALGEGPGVRFNRYPDPLQKELKEKVAQFLNARKMADKEIATLIEWGFRLVTYHKQDARAAV